MGVHMSRFLARDLIASEDVDDPAGLRGHRRRGFLARPSVSLPHPDSEPVADLKAEPASESAGSEAEPDSAAPEVAPGAEARPGGGPAAQEAEARVDREPDPGSPLPARYRGRILPRS
jgi:hypothetical protein